MNLTDLVTILPLAVLAVWATLLLLVDLWIPKDRKGITAVLAALGLALAMGLSLTRGQQPQQAFGGMVIVDGFAIFLDMIFLVSGLLSIALAHDYLKRMNLARGEYYALLLYAISGMILMTYAYDLIIVFLALELLSIPLYILSGFIRLNSRSEEAALKYFLLGAFSSGLVLYGVALIFGATARTDLPGILAAVQQASANPAMLLVGGALLLVGFSFKSAIVPFHEWVPDVYQGAPSSVTAFMSVGAKAAGFAALMRVFVTAFPTLSADFTPVLWGLSALTMIVGNVIALAQTNLKRLLAYSSIAQAGYLMMAFVPYAQGMVLSDTIAAMLFFLVGYMFTTLGAWAVVIAVEKAEGKGLEMTDYAGLGRRHPWLAAAMTLFMLSFIGVPPTLGFWGKFYLFRTAVEGGFTTLALLGLLASIFSAFYYFRVVVMMFMQTGKAEARRDPWLALTLGITSLGVIGFGLLPGSLLNLALQAVLKLL
ncbi:MAG: NADH-quinone oxidoreductase subunit N [Anaerolineaceae bacterium]|nr:NADH-quinone oxidoreductase subunit N [Anaerolineaceae bacterium]